MDFKKWKENQRAQYQSSGQSQSQHNESKKKQSENCANQGSSISSDAQKIQENIDKYMGKSQDELVDELVKVATQMKSDGKFNQKEIEEFCDRMKMFLTKEQTEKLQSLLKMIGV